MMNLIAFFSLILFTTEALANEVVVTCRGSLKPTMASVETYKVSLTDRGNIIIEGQYKDTPSIFINVDKDEVVKQNDDEGLHLESSKKRLGMVFSKQSVQINYKTGKGSARDFQTMDSMVKPRTVFLDNCRR
ncbi:hypothetical protein [Bdellovibrio sp. BCCA]|uniref:hypothetical protein n=1 Tax=unclassified Bdellovibrio TaxID=2633795 RepID=UPI0025D66610|nr:hypothetical protein [uncultured Bdellovibrio sp.]